MDSFVSQTHDSSGGFVPTGDRPKFALIANSEDRFLGTVIGDRYKILSLLGKGGMGSVYKAQHTSLGKTQAIKVLNNLRWRTILLSIVSTSKQKQQARSTIQIWYRFMIMD